VETITIAERMGAGVISLQQAGRVQISFFISHCTIIIVRMHTINAK